MQSSKAPLSISELIKKCPISERTSVYRTIDLFVRENIVKIVPIGWKQKYELTDLFKKHHHHLSCTKCGNLIDIHSKNIETVVSDVARENGFSETDHTFEIRGLCRDCK